jgi:signal transduction histidine kinase
VFCLVRQIENIWFALVAMALSGVLMSLGGLSSVLFLPHHPEQANRGPVLMIAVAVMAVAFFTHAATQQLKSTPALARVLMNVALSTVPLVILAAFGPPGITLRLECLILLSLTCCGPFILRYVRRYHIPEMSLYSLAWYALIFSLPVAILRYAGVWPDGPVSQWMLPAGFVAYGVLNSLALASLASRLRRELAMMNEKLVSNVHDLQQALAHAEEANAKAQRATKAKDEFVATMSHELRTPLNMIINIPQGLIEEFDHVRSATCRDCGASYLLDESDVIGADTACEDCPGRGTLVEGTMVKFRGDEARCLRFLQKIERSGQHLLQMVNGVLDYSKLDSGRFQLELGPVDLDALLHEVHDQLVDIAQQKKIQLEVVSQGTHVTPLEADALRLKQVLINLVANAIKFSEAETTVTVRWTSDAEGELIEVADRGIGIAPADHERIFSGFEQVHKGDTRKYGGTGLGLSISRSLVRMHGGEISVRSELSQGSTFLIRLPRVRMNASLPMHQGDARANDNGLETLSAQTSPSAVATGTG